MLEEYLSLTSHSDWPLKVAHKLYHCSHCTAISATVQPDLLVLQRLHTSLLWRSEYLYSPWGPQAKLTKSRHKDGFFHRHGPSQICQTIIHQHRSQVSAKWMVTSKICTNGANIHTISQFFVFSKSYSWFWITNTLRDLVRFGPIESRPCRIHIWFELLFRIPIGMFPKLIKIGHNFLSLLKFVKYV